MQQTKDNQTTGKPNANKLATRAEKAIQFQSKLFCNVGGEFYSSKKISHVELWVKEIKQWRLNDGKKIMKNIGL